MNLAGSTSMVGTNLYGTYGENDEEARTTPHLIWTQLRKTKVLRDLTHDQMYNHLDGINQIATKSGLYLILK